MLLFHEPPVFIRWLRRKEWPIPYPDATFAFMQEG